MGEPYLLRGFVVLLLGGLGSLAGASSRLDAGRRSDLGDRLPAIGNKRPDPLFVLFLVLVVRPSGIFGAAVADARIGRR